MANGWMLCVCAWYPHAACPLQCTLHIEKWTIGWQTKSFSTKSLIFISIKCFSPHTIQSLNLLFHFSLRPVFKWMTHDHSSNILNIATTLCRCVYVFTGLSCNDAIFIGLGKHQHWLILEKNQRLCDTEWAHAGVRYQIGSVSPAQPTPLLLLLDCIMHFNVAPHARTAPSFSVVRETEVWAKHVAQLSNCYRTCKFRWRDGFIEFHGF